MLKSLFTIFNRAQQDAKKEITREERRKNTLLRDLERSNTGLNGIFDKIEDTKKDWEKEDKREEAIKSFLDL